MAHSGRGGRGDALIARGLSLAAPLVVFLGGVIAWANVDSQYCHGEDGRDDVFQLSTRGHFCANVVDPYEVPLLIAAVVLAFAGTILVWRRRALAAGACWIAAAALVIVPLIVASSLPQGL